MSSSNEVSKVIRVDIDWYHSSQRLANTLTTFYFVSSENDNNDIDKICFEKVTLTIRQSVCETLMTYFFGNAKLMQLLKKQKTAFKLDSK